MGRRKKIDKSVGITDNMPAVPISIIADILGCHQRTLRIYDDEGILKPQRSLKNRRFYSLDDIEKGRLIKHLTQELGVNLAGIKIIFALAENFEKELKSVEDFERLMK